MLNDTSASLQMYCNLKKKKGEGAVKQNRIEKKQNGQYCMFISASYDIKQNIYPLEKQ